MENDPSTQSSPETEQQADPLAGQIAIGGLTNLAANRFADRLEARAQALRESTPQPSEMQANITKHALIPGTPETERDEDEEQLIMLRRHGLRDGAPKIKKVNEETGQKEEKEYPYATLRPVTRRERRAALRADRKLRKNMRPAVVNRTYELTYNETVNGRSVEIGTEEHATMLKSERLSRSERKEAKKAVRQYQRNRLNIDNRFDSAPETLDKLAERVRTKFSQEPSDQVPAQSEPTMTNSNAHEDATSEPGRDSSIYSPKFAPIESTQAVLQAAVAEKAAEMKAKKEQSRKGRDNNEKTVRLTAAQRELLKIDQMEALNSIIKPEVDKLQVLPAGTPQEKRKKSEMLNQVRTELIQEFMDQRGIDSSDPAVIAEISKRYMILAEAHGWFSNTPPR